jgi:D-alanine-D-alanine ligase
MLAVKTAGRVHRNVGGAKRSSKQGHVNKIRVGIVYGGRSGEHEVSIASAASIFKHLDPSRYEAVPIRIEKDGRWLLGGAVPKAISAAEVLKEARTEALEAVEPTRAVDRRSIDVVFPVLHGPYGEDGTVQGLLELANVPYVGAGVLGSAVGMDKAVMKKLFAADGLPIVPYHTLLRPEWTRDSRGQMTRIASQLGYPVFVKPANLGSSVGISKARNDAELADAVALALQYDRKVVVEAAVPNAREIECAVLGNDDPKASVPGEIVPSREFYDYEAKYLDEGSKLLIPAPLTAAQTAEIQRLAIHAFRAVDGAGMSRVDFLMSRDSDALYLNEVNTIPGFTTISMYPKMWEASGLSYPQLLDRLIALAIERHDERQALRTSVV